MDSILGLANSIKTSFNQAIGNIGQDINNGASAMFPAKTFTVYAKNYVPPTQAPIQQTRPVQQVTSVQQTPVVQSATPVSTQPNLSQVQQNIVNGFTKLYGPKSPALQYVPQIMQAIQTNQFHRDNPYLAAAQQVLETSGGLNITRPNNVTNWGINYPGNNEIFAKMSPQQVFDRYLTGVGTRDSNFAQFRTGQPLTQDQLVQYGKKYAPSDTTYGQRLYSQINAFQNP